MPSFIETQFPIARLSAESYKERKAGASQTLTGLGKWWGRKPLVLVRAAIVGMVMPASADAQQDREVFLKILTMDDDGTWARCKPQVQRKLGRAGFDALPYGERIAHCERPENVAGPSDDAWVEINAHLATTAADLPELVEQLGQRVFGHRRAAAHRLRPRWSGHSGAGPADRRPRPPPCRRPSPHRTTLSPNRRPTPGFGRACGPRFRIWARMGPRPDF